MKPAGGSCAGQDKPTHQQADAIAKRSRFDRRAYKCGSCGQWHVGRGNPVPMRKVS